ncbi:hypothetical protein [Olleya aquimaris]|uniref:Uncharacterized protein n=1 Tax=Olleya aquimaris TaxID=639310 RepID=A0A327RL99_9FLAO|nr:hypothetical protein [Olleya aquimaris]RAJ16965.1 hypothetical protein LY08_00743 [Olleya aquimaris]
MLKNVIATIVGLVIASGVVFLFESLIGHSVFPLPEGIDPKNMESLKANMHLIPVGAKVFVVIGHFAGIVCGMWIAGMISKTSLIPAYIVGGFMLAATAFNIIMLPKELWFSLADGLLAIAAFFFGKSFANRYVYGKLI